MEATLLADVLICQEYGDHHTGTCHPLIHTGLPVYGAQYQRTDTAVGGWGRITPLALKNARETHFRRNFYFMHSKTQEQKKWRQQVLFLRTNYGMQFITIVTDSTNINSALTHPPSARPEGFTRCLLCNLYNNL